MTQQFIPQEQNFYQTQEANKFQPPLTETHRIPQPNGVFQMQSNAPQSLPPGSFKSNSESGHQPPINIQYPNLNQNVNTKFKQPVIHQKNENQQSQVPQQYDLHSHGGQGAFQSLQTIKPSPSKEYQKQFPTSLNHPIPEELPDFGESSDFGQVISNDKKQENKPVQVPSKILPQLSQQTSFNSKSDFPSNTLLPPKKNQLNLPQLNPSIPSKSNKILLPQIPSQSSSNPLDKVSSTPDDITMDIKEGVLLNPQSDFLDGKFIPPTQTQLNPSIPFNSNKILLPQIPSQSSSNPSDKVSSTPNENTMDIKKGVLLNPQSDFLDGKIILPTQTQLNPSIPSNSNKILLPQIPSQSSSNPSDKVSSTPNENTMDIKEGVLLNPQSDFLDGKFIPPTQTQLNPSIPFNSNKILLPQIPSQSSSNPSDKVSSIPNENTMDIKEEVLLNPQSDFLDGKIILPTQTQLNPSIPSNSNKILLPQIPSQSSSNPSDKVSSTPNENTMDIKEGVLLNPQSDFLDGKFIPPTQTQLNPSIPFNSNKILLPQIPSQSSSNPSDKVSSIPNENTMDIKEEVLLNPQSDFLDGKIIPLKLLPQTENQLPLLSQSSLELLDKGSPTPSKNNKEVEDSEPFNSKLDFPDSIYLPPTQSQFNLPQSSTSVPPISNQVPSLSSSELLDKGPPTPNTNTMQDKNDGMSLNSISGLPDNKLKPFISNVVQNENILIDNSQKDMQTFLNPEINNSPNPLNNVSKNQDDSQLELIGTPSQLLIDNTQVENVVINNPQQDDLKKDISFNDDTQKLQNALNESPLSTNVKDTQLNQEPILEKSNSKLPIFAFNKNNKKNDELFTLDDLVFDEPLDYGLSKYDKSFIVNTENPEQDNAKNRVFANPNDVHTLLIAPTQSSTSDNSYPNNNYLLNSPPTIIPWYNPSFPNTVDYVQQPDFNTNNQLLSSLLNVYQNPSFYNQIPTYPSNNNYYSQPDAYSAIGQNQMSSKIKLPSIWLNGNQPSSNDNSGCIYKKVDLKNPPPNISNSWLLLNKDYTKNSNQNNGYTSYDGKIRTSIFGTPSTSYQNNNQGILNLSSNDMFVQNMMSVISNSLHVPLAGTKAIFDVTRANFPRAPLSHVIRLTHAVVQSVMRSLQQTLNTVMNTLYGHRSKRDFNPSDALHNLPGALIDKYSQQSTTTPTAKDMNLPYYTQPYTTGQQPMQQQQQTYYGGVTDMNYFGSQDNNNNIRFVPQPANTQNYVLNPLVEAITTAIRSNVPDPYSIDTPEVKEYTHQIIVTVEIVFKNQIDNILNGRPLTMNV